MKLSFLRLQDARACFARRSRLRAAPLRGLQGAAALVCFGVCAFAGSARADDEAKRNIRLYYEARITAARQMERWEEQDKNAARLAKYGLTEEEAAGTSPGLNTVGMLSGTLGTWQQRFASRAPEHIPSFEEKVQMVEARGRQNDVEAQRVLGQMYFFGFKVPVDRPRGISWLVRAAENDDTDSQFLLGLIYLEGEGVPVDYARAARWLGVVANKGNRDAQFYMSELCRGGLGVPQDDALAVDWLRKSAEQNVAMAQHRLGLRYYVGKSVPQDDALALSWMKKAAEQGFAMAQHGVANMYELQRGMAADAQNYVHAVEWKTKAAKQGYAPAQADLAQSYIDGIGVRADLDLAEYWLEKAAAQGDAQATAKLKALRRYREQQDQR